MPRKKILTRTNFFLFIFSAVIALVGAELVLRARGHRPWSNKKVKFDKKEKSPFTKHPTLGYTHLPGKFTKTFPDSHKITLTHLNTGNRITKPLEAYNDECSKDELWLFGCSFTYGWSLSDDETHPWLLQKKMPNYEVVNFGAIGYGTVHSFIQFQEALQKRKKPKVVVLTYASFHDERNSNLRTRQKRFAISYIGPVAQPYAYFNGDGDLIYSMAPGLIEFPLMRHLTLAHVIEKSYNRIEGRLRRKHEVSKAIIKDFAALCKKNNIPFIVAGIRRDSATADMLKFAGALGTMTVDISVDLDIKGNRNWPYDGHPSAKAQAQYAQKLEGFLKNPILGKFSAVQS